MPPARSSTLLRPCSVKSSRNGNEAHHHVPAHARCPRDGIREAGLEDLREIVDEYDRTPAAPESEFTLWPGPDEGGIEAWPDIGREVWEKLLMWIDLSEGLDRSTKIAQVSIYFELPEDEKGFWRLIGVRAACGPVSGNAARVGCHKVTAASWAGSSPSRARSASGGPPGRHDATTKWSRSAPSRPGRRPSRARRQLRSAPWESERT